MYHKSFRTREKLRRGCSSTAGYHRFNPVRETGAESRQPTTRGVVFHFRIATRCLFSPASPSIPIPSLLFPSSLHSFLSVVSYSSFCFRQTHCLSSSSLSDPRCLSSLSRVLLLSASSHSRHSSFPRVIYPRLSSFPLRSTPPLSRCKLGAQAELG